MSFSPRLVPPQQSKIAVGERGAISCVLRWTFQIAELTTTRHGPRPTRNLGTERARKIERNLQLGTGWMDRDHSNEAAAATPGDGGRTERALKLYASVEKLPQAVRKTIDQLINLFEAGQKKAKRRKKKSDPPKR